MARQLSVQQEIERFERRIAQIRASSGERFRTPPEGPPFDYDSWVRELGPPSPEDLAEMEELLRERDEERCRAIGLCFLSDHNR